MENKGGKEIKGCKSYNLIVGWKARPSDFIQLLICLDFIQLVRCSDFIEKVVGHKNIKTDPQTPMYIYGPEIKF